MKEFEKFVELYEPNIPRTREISLVDVGDAMRAAFQAGIACYAQGDLAGDERRRIVDTIRKSAWDSKTVHTTEVMNILADRIEKETI